MTRVSVSVTAVDATSPRSTPPAIVPPARLPRRATLLAGAALLLLSLVRRPPREFVYDAARYWLGSLALFTRESAVAWGDLDLRGVLTPFVYAPPALAERFVHGSGRWLVLAENGMMIAVIGAVVLPGIVRAATGGRAPAPLTVWVCAGLTWMVLGGFAPYPLMDVPAALLFVTVLWLAAGSARWWALLAAGVAAGVTLNLRPAYLLAIGAVAAGAVALHRFRGLLVPAGAVVGALPQAVFNLSRGAAPGLAPPGTSGLAGFQAGYAAYAVRYDTITGSAGAPQQFYCDPAMARAVAGRPVTSVGGLAEALLTNLPESALFLLKKIGAALAWSAETPYSVGAAAERYDLTLPIVLITVAGGFGLVLAPRRRVGLVLAGAGSAVCLSLMTSATETRFALPLVLLGIAGCALLARLPAARLRSPRLLAGAAAAVLLVLAFAVWGLAAPLPPGPSTAVHCATR
ncbi:hypothetical protein GCM10010199_01880 [Dactylosporangium roseum]